LFLSQISEISVTFSLLNYVIIHYRRFLSREGVAGCNICSEFLDLTLETQKMTTLNIAILKLFQYVVQVRLICTFYR